VIIINMFFLMLSGFVMFYDIMNVLLDI